MTETAEENEAKLFPAGVKDKAEISSFLPPEKPSRGPCSDPALPTKEMPVRHLWKEN